MTNRRNNLVGNWRRALAGGGFCTAIGLLLLWLGGWPVFLGYDLTYLFRSSNPPDEVVIVYLDDESFRELGQISTPNWDRNLHAQLLDLLTAERAKVVVFDIVFSEPGTLEANTNLARAIQQNSRVVLAAAMNYPSRAQIQVNQPLLPLPEFQRVAAGWGVAEVDVESNPGRVARRYYAGTEYHPSLPQVAASVAGIQVGKSAARSEPDVWLNYYGPAITLPHYSYSQVADLPAGTFSNKFVFIGARPTTLTAQDKADQFRTPYTLWRGEYSPGVEIGATAFLNLLRNDGLRRLGGGWERMLVLVCGLAFGGVLGRLSPRAAGGAAVIGMALLLVVALQMAEQHVWFPWTVIVFGQIPIAFAWSLRCHFHHLNFEKEVLERTLVETSRLAEAAKSKVPMPESDLTVPDHTLIRCVGKGAYGEVWLARNAIGAFHAVKLVRRRDFPSDEPYEREFKGIQKFMPISRSHPGFVHVLHVGRNDAAGSFFYIMEAADDKTSGQRIDPESYAPKTLATELIARGQLPPEECLRLGLSLALALEHLHRQQLIHRDIKPGNIIYVNGEPKFADIGLVTEQRSEMKDVSLVGTEGYIPPQGAGTPSADVYALGKVLYEACMGRDRRHFPEVPTSVWELPQEGLLRQLNTVICKACESDSAARFHSAGELHAALTKLQAAP